MSSYTQISFKGGMNLLSCDTDLAEDEYRFGFNLRNRFDNPECILESQLDVAAPEGVKQELVTFGNFLILFCAGKAYYRYYSSTGWKQIDGFSMSPSAPRYWTCVIPVGTTNYVRKASETAPSSGTPSVNNPIILENAVAQGNVSGLLVQDNINQARFIYLDTSLNVPVVRVTKTYAQWAQDAANELRREYVPIGNCMAWVDGVLYLVSQDFSRLYRSVSGRPLDFVIAVDENGDKLSDANVGAYDVGVSGISCIRAMANDSLFVAASNSNFMVTKNLAQNAPKVFGEFTFIRQFLFNSTVLSDRCILDSLGDTRFIDLTGVRSFNSILQTQNEGRNTLFSAKIQSAFEEKDSVGVVNTLVQDATTSAAILYDNYEFYALETVFGPV